MSACKSLPKLHADDQYHSFNVVLRSVISARIISARVSFKLRQMKQNSFYPFLCALKPLWQTVVQIGGPTGPNGAI